MGNFRGELFIKTSETATDEGAKSLPNQLAGACLNFKHLACLEKFVCEVGGTFHARQQC